MIRLTVLYPATPGSSFDWDYYLHTHYELLHRLLDPLGLVKFEADRCIGGMPPGEPAPFHAIAHLTFATTGDLQMALYGAGDQLMADIPQFTDSQPTVTFSEIV